MFARSRLAAAAALLACFSAQGQEPTSLPATPLRLPTFQPFTPGQTPQMAQTTNPNVGAMPATRFMRVGAQNPPPVGPEPRVVPMMVPTLPPMLGPSPMSMPPMTAAPTVPSVPMPPDAPMNPMFSGLTTPVPAGPNYPATPLPAAPAMPFHGSTLPPTTLGLYAPEQFPATSAPIMQEPHANALPPQAAEVGYHGVPHGAYHPHCAALYSGLLGHLCWTPPPAHCWVDAEYLNWWMRGTILPPLVTRGGAADAVPGALNQPGTSVIFGGKYHDEMQQGVRVTAGSRFGNSGSGWEIRGFLMDEQESSFNVGSSAAFPVLARPYFDPVANAHTSLLLGAPGLLAGNVAGKMTTRWWGAEANFTHNINCLLLDHIYVGFRYMELVDVLKMRTHYSTLAGGAAFLNGLAVGPGAFGTIEDSVRARNQFYGGQIGIRERFSLGRLMLDVRGSVAVGSGMQQVDVRGATAVVSGTTRTTATGGLIGQPSDIGRFDRNDLTVIPEASARLNFALSSSIALFAGYDFLYWANVARVGDQIDPRMDSRQIPTSPLFNGAGGTNPVVGPRSTSFWAHGVTFGLSLRY